MFQHALSNATPIMHPHGSSLLPPEHSSLRTASQDRTRHDRAMPPDSPGERSGNNIADEDRDCSGESRSQMAAEGATSQRTSRPMCTVSAALRTGRAIRGARYPTQIP